MILAMWATSAGAETAEPIGSEAPIDAAVTVESTQEPDPVVLEEIVTVGRSQSASQSLMNERLNDEVVTDILGAEFISRLGDSTVAAALKRVPGLSLVGGKFVYIRGLGERYSSTYLNGARIPSPDLTRNVIPLDIFPTSIVESLRVQKSYSADTSANFGGGSIDIRTKGIPEKFTVSFEVGSGFNTENEDHALSYPGGGHDKYGTDDGTRALSADILAATQRFQGNINMQGILSTLIAEGNTGASLQDAQLVNRQLALALNRDISLQEESVDPDIALKASVGNRMDLSDSVEFGFLIGGSYDTNWRETTRKARNFIFPDERTNTELESTRAVALSGNIDMGLKIGEDHELTTTSLFLRNTDDETAITDFFNENREVSDGIGFRDYRYQFEERNMVVNQIRGVHRLGEETRSRLPGGLAKLVRWLPEEAELTWFFSDADATTDIPNQVNVSAQTVTDSTNGAVINSAVSLDATAANYRFTDLDDDVTNYGWSVRVPFETRRSTIEASVGYEHYQKSRTYRQSQFSIGVLNVSDPAVLEGPLGDVFSDANILDPANNFVFDLQGSNNQSYLAATMTDAVFGKLDLTFVDTWRLSAGARWEDYRQVALDFNPFGFSADDPVVTTDPDVLRRGVFQTDKIYPSASLTYMTEWWAETFQLRFGWSETTVRPDLREITDASYVDPVTDDIVDGNPGIVPADARNFDIRGEWLFSGGDALTVSLFYKDINNPIEFFESAASDTTIAREIINAKSAEVYGVELEALKKLGFLGGPFESFFVQGNVTLQDSELVAGSQADAPTNPVRKLTGASDFVANVMLGFDSPDARHTASLAYNVSGERLYVAGRNGAPDGFEQPFRSLDLNYFWYPTDTITVNAKVQNILQDKIEIQRENVLTFEEDPGSTFVVSFQWAL